MTQLRFGCQYGVANTRTGLPRALIAMSGASTTFWKASCIQAAKQSPSRRSVTGTWKPATTSAHVTAVIAVLTVEIGGVSMARRNSESAFGTDKAKVRVFFAEVEGNNESVQEALKTMVSAMSRPVRVISELRSNGGAALLTRRRVRKNSMK